MSPPEKRVYEFEDFQLDPDNRILLQDGRRVNLRGKAFSVLLALVEAEGKTLTKDELISTVWPDTAIEENNLQVHITHLRKKVLKKTEAIQNIPGVGYRFSPAVKSSLYVPLERGQVGARKLLRIAAIVLIAIGGGVSATFLMKKVQARKVRAVMNEAALKEISFYKNPEAFSREQLRDYWVMPEQGGQAAPKIENGVKRLIRDEQIYGQDAKPEVFEQGEIAITYFGFGDTATVPVREVWYLPVYDKTGVLVQPNRVHQDFGEAKYELHKVSGKWLIFSTSAYYRKN